MFQCTSPDGGRCALTASDCQHGAVVDVAGTAEKVGQSTIVSMSHRDKRSGGKKEEAGLGVPRS